MEAEMRRKMVEEDQIEAVIGLGANLFYNSPMEAMILVGNTNKPAERQGKVLFINGKDDVIDNKGLAYLTDEHIDRFYNAFKEFKNIPNYAKVATIEEILSHDGNMNINFYVKREKSTDDLSFGESYRNWEKSGEELSKSMNSLFEVLK
jgi:type I restriction enzyme M protein